MADEIKRSMTINGQVDPTGYRMIAALIGGAINAVPGAHLEFIARNKKLVLGDLVGTEMGFWVKDEDGKKQPFWGTCISAESKGTLAGEGHYVAEIRPWLWFLSRTQGNRIFQNMKTTDIVKEILGEYGFSGDLKVKHSNTDAERVYCVQYRETDLDFIKRLLEEEGFYFYFAFTDSSVEMILADQPSTHGSASADDKYLYSDGTMSGAREQITVWKAVEQAVTGKVTLRDFDFTKPSSDLTATSSKPSGTHGHKSYETYVYPGRYRDVSKGESRAAAMVEEHAAEHQTWSANGTMLNLNVGKIFEIKDHPRHEKAADNGFMVTRMTQFVDVGDHLIEGGSALKHDSSYWDGLGKGLLEHLGGGATGKNTSPAPGSGDAAFGYFHTAFEAVLKSKPYRGTTHTPKPRMDGVQTAIVTGPSGDELAVDKYGRIKVQFHWDRDGKNDEKTSCWVRTMMPWTGKNWGMVGLPRIGQEVVIQFEEGDPDRPLCVGMLYNAETMPPYDLPADATRTGIKTNTSKGGGGYNELMMEDAKDKQIVRFMAERDFYQNTQNRAHIKVGYPHENDIREAKAQDNESMKLEVKNHLDEIVETGDHSFLVKTGMQTIEIEKDKTEKVNKNFALTVTDDYDTTVDSGNLSMLVSSGDMSSEVSSGNITVDANAGKINVTAAQSIELKCGGSSIKLEPAGITISSVTVDISGEASLNAGAPMTEVKGDAMLILKGGMTKIN